MNRIGHLFVRFAGQYKPNCVNFRRSSSIRALNIIQCRAMSSNGESAEMKMTEALKSHLNATHVHVEDVSGGCGAMYRILVVSEKFKNTSLMQQHRMVNGVLGNEIAQMHGLTLQTYTPEQYDDKVAQASGH